MAVRELRQLAPRTSHADDAAAAAVFSGGLAEGCDRLPCGGERVQFGSGQRCSHLGGPASARVAAGGTSALEPNALLGRATAPRARTRAVARAAISVPR